MESNASSAVLRSTWLQGVVREAQVFVGAAAHVPLASFGAAVRRFVNRLPKPANAAECFAARVVLLEATIGAGSIIHARLHGSSCHRCDFNPSEAAVRLWRQHRSEPARFLREWAVVVQHRLGGDPGTFRQAIVWCAQQLSQPVTVEEAAAALGIPATTIERAFRHNAGLSFSKYQRGLRMVKAIELLTMTDEKIEGVAFDVGFRSKKNFYKAIQEWLGTTPRALRAQRSLPLGWDERIPAVFRSHVRCALRGGVPAGRQVAMAAKRVTEGPAARLRA